MTSIYDKLCLQWYKTGMDMCFWSTRVSMNVFAHPLKDNWLLLPFNRFEVRLKGYDRVHGLQLDDTQSWAYCTKRLIINYSYQKHKFFTFVETQIGAKNSRLLILRSIVVVIPLLKLTPGKYEKDGWAWEVKSKQKASW